LLLAMYTLAASQGPPVAAAPPAAGSAP
jgi:hypothetical protein